MFVDGKGSNILVQFKADSEKKLSELTKKLIDNGSIVLQNMKKTSYGILTTFKDPAGNVIEILFEK